MNKNILKGFGAVLAGMLAGAILSVATDSALEAVNIFPPISTGLFVPWMLALALAYRGAYTILSGYVTARLAPDRPMRHVAILGTIGVILSTLGTIVGWDLSSHWYPISLVLITLPCVWLGGKLYIGNR